MQLNCVINYIVNDDLPLFSNALEEYLADPGHTINDNDCFGRRALIEAVCEGKLDILKFIVEKGASLDVTTIAGETPLMIASEKGHWKIVEYLLEQNVDIYQTDPLAGESVLMHLVATASCAQADYLGVFEFLVKKGGKRLIDFQRQNSGDTVLMYAAKRGHIEDIDFLLRHGANLNLEDALGVNAVSHAYNKNHSNAVDILMHYGANVTRVVRSSNKDTLKWFKSICQHYWNALRLMPQIIPVCNPKTYDNLGRLVDNCISDIATLQRYSTEIGTVAKKHNKKMLRRSRVTAQVIKQKIGPICLVSLIGDYLYQDTKLLSAFNKAVTFSKPLLNNDSARKIKRKSNLTNSYNNKTRAKPKNP